jgi:hypothetical protein
MAGNLKTENLEFIVTVKNVARIDILFATKCRLLAFYGAKMTLNLEMTSISGV